MAHTYVKLGYSIILGSLIQCFQESLLNFFLVIFKMNIFL